MKSSGIVFEVERSMGAMPDELHDLSRYGQVCTSKTPGSEPGWVRLPSGLWVMSFASDYVGLGNPGFAKNQAGTILMWLYTTTTNEQHYLTFAKYSTGAVDEFKMELKAGDFRLEVHDNTVNTHKLETTNNSFPINTWHLVGFTSSGSANLLSKNGMNQPLTASVGANDGVWLGDLTSDADLVTLGSLPRSSAYLNDFAGRMAPPLILDYALSIGQIYNIFQAERGLFGV